MSCRIGPHDDGRLAVPAEETDCMQNPWRRLSGLPVTIAQVLCCFREIDSKEAVSLPEIFVMGRAVTEQGRKEP